MNRNQTTRIIVSCVVVVAVAITAVTVYRRSEADRLQKEREARAKQDSAMMTEMNRRHMETYRIDMSPMQGAEGYKPFATPRAVTREPAGERDVKPRQQ